MVTESARPQRADAARNSEKLVRAAREVYTASGPDASLEEVARHAGVGIRTLHRHFPYKVDLIRAVLALSIAEDITPAIERAHNDDDPLHGVATVIEAAVALAAREHNTLAAATTIGLAEEISTPFYESLTVLVQRAQQAGLVRADIVPDDLPRIMAMLFGMLWTMNPEEGGWQRYVAFILDALSPTGARPLPIDVPPLRLAQPKSWPI